MDDLIPYAVQIFGPWAISMLILGGLCTWLVRRLKEKEAYIQELTDAYLEDIKSLTREGNEAIGEHTSTLRSLSEYIRARNGGGR